MDGEPRPRPEPGEPRRVLERPPGERFAAVDEASALEASGDRRRGVALRRAFAAAGIGAALIVFLGGPVSVTLGLLGVATGSGLVIGSFLRPSAVLAITIAVASVVVGLLGVWGFARLEGGVLDPVAYLLEVHGPLVALDVVAAAAGALVGSR